MTDTAKDLPARIEDGAALEELLSRPSPELARELAGVPGDIMVLGVGGKMGPSLARMAKRAAPQRRVIGVARFSEPGLRERLQADGVECIAADLLSREALARLPDAPNIVFMAGRKFGSTGSEWQTWAMNAHVPALVAERFASSRIVAFSTACVYPFVPSAGEGAPESLPPTAPSGEYANSCVARERLFEHFSHALYMPSARYASPSDGDTKSVRTLTRDDVRAFYAARYRPAATTLVVAGIRCAKKLLCLTRGFR